LRESKIIAHDVANLFSGFCLHDLSPEPSTLRQGFHEAGKHAPKDQDSARFSSVFHRIIDIPEDGLFALIKRYWQGALALEKFYGLAEQPWISQGPSCNHHPVTSCLCEHFQHIAGCTNIAIAYNGNGAYFLDPRNERPVSPASEFLSHSPGMHGHGINTAFLRNPRKSQCLLARRGPSGPHLYGHGA